MQLLISTENIPRGDRFFHYRQAYLQDPSPADAYCDQPGEFSGSFERGELGAVRFARTVSHTEGVSGLRRDARLIRRSDPEEYRLVLNQYGFATITHKCHNANLRPGDMTLIDTSQPVHGWREPGEGRLLILAFSRDDLPVPQRATAEILGARLCGRTGIGALLWTTAIRSARDLNSYNPTDAMRVCGALLSLAGGVVANELEKSDVLSTECQRQVLFRRIQRFIECHLGDADLTPTMIAQAHHISVRTVHRLFESQSWTVAEWIRTRRLSRCRQDLIEPWYGDRTIQAIASRWGFTKPQTFIRAFRAAYGMSPMEYRRRLPK
jgi:AraC-like DNA-binding protein